MVEPARCTEAACGEIAAQEENGHHRGSGGGQGGAVVWGDGAAQKVSARDISTECGVQTTDG